MVPGSATFAVAFSCSATFAALLPLGNVRLVPPIVRAAFALSITPIVMFQSPPSIGGDVALLAGCAALAGASIGLSTSAVAGAAAAAGSIIDQAVAGGISADGGGAREAGPFALLMPLMFAYVSCSSGMIPALVFLVAHHSLGHAVNAASIIVGGRMACRWAIEICLAPMLAHAVATIAAGSLARLAPRVNAMLLAPATGSPLAIGAVLIGAVSTLFWLHKLSALTVHLAR
ncbi:MAG: flagellar biosynthetic protein FliR [Candidatus Eremiobacteraeota bacterium]|nr:flagellar biosynthetic protein FliR [Candidatus Eremiobacteraeota bacterium]